MKYKHTMVLSGQTAMTSYTCICVTLDVGAVVMCLKIVPLLYIVMKPPSPHIL